MTFLFVPQVEGETTEQSGPWLQDCIVSLSPCADLLVVALGQKAVFLSGQIFRYSHSWFCKCTEVLHSIVMTIFIDFPQQSGVPVTVAERRWPWLCPGPDSSALTMGKTQVRRNENSEKYNWVRHFEEEDSKRKRIKTKMRCTEGAANRMNCLDQNLVSQL